MGLSNAERQARWQAKRKAELEALRKATAGGKPDGKTGPSPELIEARTEIAALRKRIAALEQENAALKATAKANAPQQIALRELREEHEQFEATVTEMFDQIQATWQQRAEEKQATPSRSRERQAAAQLREIAELTRLKVAMTAAHPDHGGTNEAFRVAHARYNEARKKIAARNKRTPRERS